MLQTISGQNVCPLGLAGNPDMEPESVRVACDAGIHAFFFYNLSFQAMITGLKSVIGDKRDDLFIATGSEDRDINGLRTYLKTVQKALQVKTVDAFFIEYVSPDDAFEDVMAVLGEIQNWKKQGWVRYVGVSVHDRDWALKLIECGKVDVLMHRYNMAHRKSEEAVLPAAKQAGIPVVSFTNTRWGSLLKGHPKWEGPLPTAADCYRFVLRHFAVQLAWMAPKNMSELRENLTVLKANRMMGPEVAQWKTYGDLVYGTGKDAFETRWP